MGVALLGRARDEDAARARFETAVGVARGQQAKGLELRATISLGRLWIRQGRPDGVRGAISAVYAGFTEGYDTPDLQDARALIASLPGDTLDPRS